MTLIKTFETETGQKIPYRIAKRRAGDVDISFAKTDKSKEVLGWSPSMSIEEMCTDSWLWFKSSQDTL